MLALPREAQIWLPGYLRDRARHVLRRWRGVPLKRLWVMIADHYEPLWRRADEATGRARVAAWQRRWPEIAARHRDAAGRPPRYTFFYPQEQYRPAFLDALAGMARQGIADVEVHLHHDREGERDFVERIRGFVEALADRHGLLRRHGGKIAFGFIHGNWALDNSLPGGRWCGLNNEIRLLGELGCYADFTMPSGASPTQARLVNTIYWAVDDPARPKSYDTGRPVEPGGRATGDLLMIPGPLGIRWAERLLPRLETGEVAAQDPPTAYRVRRWLALAPRIGGDGFLKLHTHGAQEAHLAALLEGQLDRLFALLAAECRRQSCELGFVSAWEMYQAVERAAGGVACPADKRGEA